MKNKILLSVIIVVLFFVKNGLSQDVIILRNGDEINAKIIRIDRNSVTYKEAYKTNGRLYNVNRSEIFMIKYKNGEKSVFSNPNNNEPVSKPVEDNSQNVTHIEISKHQQIEQQKSPPIEKNKSVESKNNNYFSIALGWGNSYGGLGIRTQLRSAGTGFGIHAGIGYFPSDLGDIIMASGGIKWYFTKSLYLDSQFGIFGESAYFYYEYDNGNYYTYNDTQILYGPSSLVGGDWVWGNYGLNAALGISYCVNGYYSGTVIIAIDLGFIIRF